MSSSLIKWRHKKRSLSRGKLPIWPLRHKLIKLARCNPALVIVGETGSGKTTQLPFFLHENGVTQSGGIFCTQPRRLAAVTVAQRVAEEMGVGIGRDVGYSVRFEDITNPWTQIKYVTDGYLLRETIENPLLSKYCVAILDEAHERALRTDILLGIIKSILTQRPDSLRVIAMSATLDSLKISEYLGRAPCSHVSGRQFPVRILFTDEHENKSDLFRETINTVLQIHLEEPPGDILVFLPGQEHIESVEHHLRNRIRPEFSTKVVRGFVVATIFSNLPADLQMRAFNPPPPGYRKIILATNIAETSVTIKGVRYVVDPGLVKRKLYNTKIGCDSITTCPVSQAQSRQRAGRAGRESSGKCFRMYSEKSFLRLNKMAPTDISKSDLISAVLQLKSLGIDDMTTFDFLCSPSTTILSKSLELLLKLEAVNSKGDITNLGYEMSLLPVEPMFAKTLLISGDLHCSKEALILLSMLSTEKLYYTSRTKKIVKAQSHYLSQKGDMITLLNICRAFMKIPPKKQSAFCDDYSLNPRSFQKALDIHRQLARHLKRLKIPLLSCGENITALTKALAIGFSPHAALKRPNGQYMVITSGQLVEPHPSSVTETLLNKLPTGTYVVFNEQLLTSRHYIKDITVIKEAWIVEKAKKHFKTWTIGLNINRNRVQ